MQCVVRDIRPADFRNAMGAFPTGVTVVTVRAESGDMHGITVNAFCSVSLDPPLVLVCLGKGRGADCVASAGVFAVNVLTAEQEHLSRTFASCRRPSGNATFAGLRTRLAVTGSPLLVDAAAAFDCLVRRSVPAGDHTVVIAEVLALTCRPSAEPLVFHAGTYGELATAPPPRLLAV